MKRLSLWYVTAYLLGGGAGLAFAPDLALSLLFSNGDYGDVMPRVAGVLMLGLGGFVGQFAWFEDYRYYRYSVYLRSFFVAFFVFLWQRAADPLFLALIVIILVGLVPSIVVVLRERRSGAA